MSGKWSGTDFTDAASAALTDTVVGLKAGSNVRYALSLLAALFGVTKFAANIGDGTNVSYTVTHSLGTRDVQVKVYRNATPWDEVIVDVAHTTANTLTVLFSTAPTTNQFRVLVWA
jgi:hypothetical protein